MVSRDISIFNQDCKFPISSVCNFIMSAYLDETWFFFYAKHTRANRNFIIAVNLNVLRNGERSLNEHVAKIIIIVILLFTYMYTVLCL
jgi:hypothetical protein